MVKKTLLVIGIMVLSLLITFLLFEIMSWYDFGSSITSVVLFRIIICFIIIFIVLLGITFLIKKQRINKIIYNFVIY
mgnify:CR=1 FL=1